jgi:hypothetical protein
MQLVKILYNDDGEKQNSPKWHLVTRYSDSPRAVCTGEVFGMGESRAVYKDKYSEKGGITCPKCLEIIKWYKSIKL